MMGAEKRERNLDAHVEVFNGGLLILATAHLSGSEALAPPAPLPSLGKPASHRPQHTLLLPLLVQDLRIILSPRTGVVELSWVLSLAV